MACSRAGPWKWVDFSVEGLECRCLRRADPGKPWEAGLEMPAAGSGRALRDTGQGNNSLLQLHFFSAELHTALLIFARENIHPVWLGGNPDNENFHKVRKEPDLSCVSRGRVSSESFCPRRRARQVINHPSPTPQRLKPTINPSEFLWSEAAFLLL